MKTLLILAAVVVAAAALKLDEEEVQKKWADFKNTHGKTYESETDEAYRMKIFKEKLAQITKHNERFEKGEVTYKKGINKFSDMLSHEVTEKLNGYRSGMKPQADRVHEAPENWWPWPWHKVTTTPRPAPGPSPSSDSVDWRKEGYVTPIKDQGQCGSCWSFSTTGSLEGQLFKKNGKLVSLSEQQLVDCSTRNDGCDGGLMDTAFSYIKSNGGIESEESYPYTSGRSERAGSCKWSKSKAVGTDTGFVDVRSGSESALKDAVSTVGPIAVAIDASWDSFQDYAGGVYFEEKCSSTNLDHGVLAIGYGTENGQDYWLVKNSWGTAWGEEGYIKIARNKNNHCGIATEASYPTV